MAYWFNPEANRLNYWRIIGAVITALVLIGMLTLLFFSKSFTADVMAERNGNTGYVAIQGNLAA